MKDTRIAMDDSEIAATFNLLGALFMIDPVDPQFAAILEGFDRRDLLNGWPSAEPEKLADIAGLMYPAGRIDVSALHDAFNDLFVGPTALQAPPWGSVYLDDEHVLYGASTLLLRDFLQQEDIIMEVTAPGPEDHFGSLCWVGAWLAAEGRMDGFDEMLAKHLLPFAFLYLDALERAADETAGESNPSAAFYAGAARLARLTLQTARDARQIEVKV